MDKREALKGMLNNLINDRHEEATADLHSYLTAKMKDVAGFNPPATEFDTDDDVAYNRVHNEDE